MPLLNREDIFKNKFMHSDNYAVIYPSYPTLTLLWVQQARKQQILKPQVLKRNPPRSRLLGFLLRSEDTMVVP